jgi:hypothetical protein
MTAKIRTHARTHELRHRHKPRGVSHRAFEKVYWPYLPVVIVVSAILSFGSYGSALTSKVRHPSGHVLAYATSMSVQGLLGSTNAARSANRVAPLTLNSKLDASAQAKANDMAARDYWSHNTPDGNPPWVFVDAQGYAYQKLGENLATGFDSEQATIDGWMASPPHRENLLDPAFVDVGFGYANITDYTAVGGGPMTIIVAHYGEPTVGAQAAPVSSQPTSSTPSSPSSTQNVGTTGSQLSTQKSSTSSSPTKTETKGDTTLSLRTSRAQTIFADMPIANLATGLSCFIMFGAIGLWVSKHLIVLRRVFTMGEAFVIHHPLIDVGLFSLAALGFLLSQTVGFIK